MNAATSGKPAAHINCSLQPHCPRCGWLVCAEPNGHGVVISRRPGATLNREIPVEAPHR